MRGHACITLWIPWNRMYTYVDWHQAHRTNTQQHAKNQHMDASQGFESDQPSPSPSQPHTSEDDGLHGTVAFIKRMSQHYPHMHTLLLCPITQLSQAAAYNGQLTNCSIISRPACLSNLYKGLQDVIQAQRGLGGAEEPRAHADAQPLQVTDGQTAPDDATAVYGDMPVAVHLQQDQAGASVVASGFPSHEIAAEIPRQQQGASEGADVVVHEALKLKALVASSDGAQRMMIKAILSRDSHEVDISSSGEDARNLLHAQSEEEVWAYDVVFLDAYMQVRDCVVLCGFRCLLRVFVRVNIEASFALIHVLVDKSWSTA